MSTGACLVCGGPADIVQYWGMRIVGCPCVPRERAYLIPVRIGETPLVASPHLPEGIAVLDMARPNHDPGDEDRSER